MRGKKGSCVRARYWARIRLSLRWLYPAQKPIYCFTEKVHLKILLEAPVSHKFPRLFATLLSLAMQKLNNPPKLPNISSS